MPSKFRKISRFSALAGVLAAGCVLLNACSSARQVTRVDLATQKDTDIELYVTDVKIVPHEHLGAEPTFTYEFKYNPDDYKNPYSYRIAGHANDLSLWEPTLTCLRTEDGTPTIIERIKVPREQGIK